MVNEGSFLKYEKTLILVLFAVTLALSVALSYVWWQALTDKSISRPGTFLKIDKKFNPVKDQNPTASPSPLPAN